MLTVPASAGQAEISFGVLAWEALSLFLVEQILEETN